MKRNPQRIITIAISLVALLFSSCFLLPGDKHTSVSHSYDGYTEATVINYTVDGCSYLLQLADGKKLEPDNLKDEFKKDNLKVWVQYQHRKGGNSICMAGEMITITAIELKK